MLGATCDEFVEMVSEVGWSSRIVPGVPDRLIGDAN